MRFFCLLLSLPLGLTQPVSGADGPTPIQHPGIGQYAEQLGAYQARPDAWSEAYRPRYHFTPFRYWQNDPNGLAWFNGEWHFFYQHYLTDLCGVSWGHAVSPDLVHWKHLPPAIPADPLGAIYSGSGVVDTHDTSGFFGGRPGYVGVYTYHNAENWESQGLAYSPDGRTFFSHPGNPVIPDLRSVPGQRPDRAFRDPKVFWHEPTKRWIMVVAGGILRIFSSPNLRDWTFESINEDIRTECPDLFQLPVEGRPGEIRWVLSKGGFGCLLGEFDGHRFTPQGPELQLNHGTDAYATQSWSNAPGERRILTSWLYFWGYEGEWLGPEGNAQSIPTELTLCEIAPGELRLRQTPVPELRQLRGAPVRADALVLADGVTPFPAARGRELEVIAEFDLGAADEVGLILAQGRGGEGTVVGYRRAPRELFVDRTRAGWNGLAGLPRSFEGPMRAENGRVRLHVFLDRTSVEVLGDDGLTNISAAILPQAASDGLALYAKGAGARLVSLEVFPLRQIHPAPPTDAPARVDLWKYLTLIQGREQWLGARAWPAATADLAWSTDNPSGLEILDRAGEWVRVRAARPGRFTLTAALPGGAHAECAVGVLPSTLTANVDFVFAQPGWEITPEGLRHSGALPSWIAAQSSALEATWSADVTLGGETSSAGLFLRADGQGSRGVGFELRAAEPGLVHGVRGNVPHSGRDVRGTKPLQVRACAVPVGRPVRLEVEWRDGRLRARVDGSEIFDLPQPRTQDWTRVLGLSAQGAATFQNITLH